MRQISISSPEPAGNAPAFTLVEVVVALGVLAVTVVSVLVLQGAIGQSAAENSAAERVRQLVDPSLIELARMRDSPVAAGRPDRLDALAEVIPASGSAQPFRLFADRAGARVMAGDAADDPESGMWSRDRYYLIEVRQQPPPLDYRRAAGYLALTLTVRWPYQIATGPRPVDFAAADLEHASVVVFNCALTP